MNKVALFGGTFDPVHLGHTACVQHLVEKMDFDQIFLIPTSLNPLKQEVKPASKENRLKMLEIAMQDYTDAVKIDSTEINQDGPSYSIDTIKKYREQYDSEQLFLVLGIDTFADFDRWRDFEEILENTNIVVVSRPPYRRPLGKEELPKGIQPLVNSYERGFALLESNRTIEFVSIKTEDISSSIIRKRLKSGKNIESFVDINVEKFVKENDVYPQLVAGEIDFKKVAQFVGGLLRERAMNALGYDLSAMDKLYDYTLIASATSTKQAQSLSVLIKDGVKDEFGIGPFGIEGKEDGRWVILDYGALIVHIFYDFVRHEYHLEQLWKDADRLDF